MKAVTITVAVIIPPKRRVKLSASAATSDFVAGSFPFFIMAAVGRDF